MTNRFAGWMVVMAACCLVPSAASSEDAVESGLCEQLDVIYAEYGDRALRLDLWRPSGGPARKPAIVVVHGGGWFKGSKERFRPLAKALARRGYITAAVEYRLGGEALFPAAVQDCLAAVRWLRRNAASYGIDPERVGAVGGSAGGHLVGLMAAAADHPRLRTATGDEHVSSRIQAAVVLAGPWQLAEGPVAERSRLQPQSSPVNRWLGKTVDEDPDLHRLASPYTHLTRDTAPTLFLAGELDRPERNRAARDRLQELGVPTGIQVYEKGKHGCWNREPWRTRMVLDIDAFFTATLRHDPSAVPLVVRQRRAWGTISQTAYHLVLQLDDEVELKELTIPRLYSPIGAITMRAGEASQQEQTQNNAVKPLLNEWKVAVAEATYRNREIAIRTVEPFASWTLPPIVSSRPGPRPPLRTKRPDDSDQADSHTTDSRKVDAVVLPAHMARTHGEMLRYEPQPHKNCVGYWVNAGDWCNWRFYLDEAGAFDVVIAQGCGKGQGGSRVAIKCGGQSLGFTVEDTGHFQNFKPRRIGTLSFTEPGVYQLRLECLEKAAKAVMDVRQIRLVPRSPSK